jgi:carboxyl-terminal processing protease
LRNSALSETFSDQVDPHAPTYKTDKGRSVKGGGGIQPDLPVTPAALTRLETVLDASGVLTSFATDYLAKHAPLKEPLEITPSMLDELKVFLAARAIQPGLSEWTAERPWVSVRLKEELVTQARGVAQADEIQSGHDPQVQTALSAVRDKNVLAALSSR